MNSVLAAPRGGEWVSSRFSQTAPERSASITISDNQLDQEGPTRGKENSQMARKQKRPYGSGCLLKVKNGWAIRWREKEIGPDGKQRAILKYEALGTVAKK